MEQVWITKVGPPETLQLKVAPDPEPKANEVRIRVKASGINFADIMARLGLYPGAVAPIVVGYEVSGEVDKVGAGITRFKAGDKVIGICKFGGYSDTVSLPELQVFALPTKMSFEQGASIPVNYLTAYQMLFGMGAIQKGDVIFVHSIGGGVGFACIDLCKIAGARIMGTASKHKHKMLKERGVEFVVEPGDDYVALTKKANGGKGVDMVLDPVGGDSWKKGLELLRPTGRLVVFGFSKAASSKKRSVFSAVKNFAQVPWLQFNPINLMNSNKGVLGVHLGMMWDEQERLLGWAQQILRWYDEGKINPTVDSTFAFKDAAKAHHYIQDRKNLGKVLLTPN